MFASGRSVGRRRSDGVRRRRRVTGIKPKRRPDGEGVSSGGSEGGKGYGRLWREGGGSAVNFSLFQGSVSQSSTTSASRRSCSVRGVSRQRAPRSPDDDDDDDDGPPEKVHVHTSSCRATVGRSVQTSSRCYFFRYRRCRRPFGDIDDTNQRNSKRHDL